MTLKRKRATEIERISEPTFQSTITNADYEGVGRRPHVISMRAIVTGANVQGFDKEVWLRAMVAAVKNAGARSLGQFGFTRRKTIDGQFTLLLPTGEAKRYRRITHLSDIDEQMVQDLFEELMDSDNELALETVELQLVLFRDTWVGGRGRKLDIIFEGVSCAAVAIILATEKIALEGVKDKVQYYRMVNGECLKVKHHANILQAKLGWNEFVSTIELQEFVKFFPKFRLTLLMPNENSHAHHTWEGKDFVFEEKTPYIIYISLDLVKKHYSVVKFPSAYFNKVRNGNTYVLCDRCVKVTRYDSSHECIGEEKLVGKKKIYETKFCEECNKQVTLAHKHGVITCRSCNGDFNGNNCHRCVVMSHEKEDQGFYKGGPSKKGVPALWIYDIESGLRHEEVGQHVIEKFAEDSDGYYKVMEHNYSNRSFYHYANLLCAKNPYTGEKVFYEGTDCIDQFFTMLNDYNKGDCIALAHNGSGYDTRLIFEYLAINRSDLKLDQISNGTRILQLSVNAGSKDGRHVIFRDSLLHLPSSLRGLTLAFNDGSVEMAKGYYPHLFNTVENIDYVGQIPSREFFDITFSCRNEKERNDFLEWYEKNKDQKEWSNRIEKRKYCENDVECLSMVVMNFTKVIFETYGLNPFKYMTGPSMVHELSKRRLTTLMELGDPKDEGYINKVEEAAKNYWAILKPQEYVMAKNALRGGRTDARKIMTEITDEMWERGERIKYVDVCSMYPWEQAINLFPVGYPQIHVVNELYRPCFTHRHSIEFCNICPKNDRFSNNEDISKKGMLISSGPWDLERFKDIGGFVACEITAPNMVHPVLVTYDPIVQKSIAPCGKISGVFTINAINVALANGYVMNEVFRVDIYKMAPSLWEDLTIDFTIGKMCASESEPNEDRQQQLVDFFETNFEAGDRISKTFGKGLWGRNELRRSVFKILNNCGWGKHCQAVIKPQKVMANFSISGSEDKVYLLYANVMKDIFSLKNVTPFTDNVFSYTFTEDKSNPNLRNTYLPAGCHVPDYGRLTLWTQMNKLGKRVIYNDTDSIVYHFIPGEYQIPQGDMWGEWEEEKISVKGIRTFAAFGAKSYAVNGPEKLLKLKGIQVNRAHGKMLSVENLIEAQKRVLISGKEEVMMVPQTSFVYRPTMGLKTSRTLKKLTLSLDNYKGPVGRDGYVYPPGYNGSDFIAFQ